ncbi:MAG: IPT/TIG domain-containing protein [Acidobacteriota bacterium]
MSNGSASVSLPAGGTATASLGVPNPHVCQIARTVTFPHARSFVEPTPENKAAFADLLTRLGIGGALNRLLITGHTDSDGDDALNDALSERRAQCVQAVIQGRPAVWEALFSPAPEGWGTTELTAMTAEVGETDIAPYLGTSAAVRTAREGLIRRYFARLLGGRTVPAITPTAPPLLACGKRQLLRGSRTSPSRDPAQPPILGDFRPNRRSEFFFFDSSPSSITVADYPGWTGTCSLTPPAPPAVTVTIAPLETIRNGANTDVQVTVTPSPLPFGSRVILTLSTTGGTGEARFASGGAATLTIAGSGPVTLRGVTPSSAPDNIRLSAAVAGRPGILAQEDFTVVDAVAFFLRFEVWSLTARAFVPLPAGVDVEVMDSDPLDDDPLATGRTDAAGRVFLNLSALNDPDETTPDVFFLVHTNGRSHAGHTLPAQWSTNGWRAADGSPGLIPDFAGGTVGSASAPRVFRVGLDFHIRLEYRNGSTGSFEPAPAQIPVDFHSTTSPGSGPAAASSVTDADGEVHAVVFDVEAGDDAYFQIDFSMTDPGINLPRARVFMDPPFWNTFWADTDRKDFPDNDRTSIGTQTGPEILRCTVNERNVALYLLKILREWSIFLFRITGGAWTGVQGLTMFRRSISGVAYSWPVGEVNFPPSSHFNRRTIVHELSHQIMWKEVNFSSLGIAYQGIFGNLALYHRLDLLSNPMHALIEGWAEFVQAIFEGSGTPPYSVSTVRDSGGTSFPLGPPPNNRGESVEGAFANGLWAIFESHVVTPAVSPDAHVPESRNGDIETTARVRTYLRDAGVRARFLSMIWEPLRDLRTVSSPTTTDMIARIQTRNAAVWHQLQPELQAFNMAMVAPTVATIAPAGGPPSGGTAVTITGTGFTLGTTTVTIGGAAATGVTVTGSASLTATTPPGTIGAADVVVSNPSGSATLTGGFLYAPAPVITEVRRTGDPAGTPARGDTEGGTAITIVGTGFQPGAEVFLGGLPSANGVAAVNANASLPTQITAETPLFPLPGHSPGGTAVVVRNPDGQTGTLNPGFEYFLLPAPRISLLSPRTGSSAGGDVVLIDGGNFRPGVRVLFAGSAGLVDDAALTASRIRVLTPSRPAPVPAGAVNVRVVNRDGQEAEVTGGFIYLP